MITVSDRIKRWIDLDLHNGSNGRDEEGEGSENHPLPLDTAVAVRRHLRYSAPPYFMRRRGSTKSV